MSEDNRSHCVEDTDSQEDEDYNPISSGSISEEADYSDSNEGESVDHSDEEEAEDELPSNSDIGVEDEVLEDTELDEDQMSDAASFEFDNEFMADGAADEESDSKHRPSKQMRGVPFRVGRNEQIKLEVGQLFQNLQHFRQVIRDFAVQDGFQLRRVKNERDRYTAECAYEGCGWRIHDNNGEEPWFLGEGQDSDTSSRRSYDVPQAICKLQGTEGGISKWLQAIVRARRMSFERQIPRSVNVSYRDRCKQWGVSSGMVCS
ncbi:hypothetical protein ACOSQ3_018504 [Xanthoceras sorbifolium]